MTYVDKCTKIVNEVFTLRFKCEEDGNSNCLESRLQELLHSAAKHDAEILAMYLRACCVMKEDLPSWQPLLNRSVEIGKMNGVDVEDAFYGLLSYK
jgi:hypothetical protein